MRPIIRAVVFASLCSFPLSSLNAQGARYFGQTYYRASHNWAFRRNYPNADRLFNAFDYGHAILYQTLWRQPAGNPAELEDKQFGFITENLLVHPPSVMLDERAVGPDWAKLAPEVLVMFEWAHMLHRQIYDVWADERIPVAQKDASVARLLKYYKARSDLAFSSVPKDMDLMEGQPYSLAFRKKYPKYNGLIWSYHWMQMTLYDALMQGRTSEERQANVAKVVGLFMAMIKSPSTLPAVMPMTPAIAPTFTARYPEAAAVFDNLHSLHDVVSDILANPAIAKGAKRETILAAAAHYRDDRTSATTVGDWVEMARSMGVDKMGGRPVFGANSADSANTTKDRH